MDERKCANHWRVYKQGNILMGPNGKSVMENMDAGISILIASHDQAPSALNIV
jgi:hypothetical protein